MNNVPLPPPSRPVMAPAQDSPTPEAGGPSMRRYVPGMSAQRRQRIIDESRAAGLLGSKHLPDFAHCEDIGDHTLTLALDAHALGLSERGST